MTYAGTVTDTTESAVVPGGLEGRISKPVGTLEGSAILRIAAEVRERQAAGEEVCNLTVGDFDPKQFRIPALLEDAIVDALRAGETNYPPSLGVPPLRDAIAAYYERDLGLRYPTQSILVTSGSRPGVYGAYAAICDPDDRVVFGVPSWNNNYYCHMVGARAVPVECASADGFMPSAASLAAHLPGARLLALNSPLNPCGTCFTSEALAAICDMVLAENDQRQAGERPLYLIYDQVYWQLTMGAVEHVDPVSLRPDMARYTVYIDGISKAFAATGVRVGWMVGPTDVIEKANNFLQHVGTWAPRAEQIASARLLLAPDVLADFRQTMLAGIQERLDAFHFGIQSLKSAGYPVDCIAPQGAIYLSARFDLRGRTTPEGTTFDTSEDVRRWLLRVAGMAVVPFEAFGSTGEPGWCRVSVGAASPAAIARCLPLLRAGLESLS
ncbi:MAG: pyridoxal phosphate-dependent aminotransferase [Gemmatimonadota bacterium]